MGRDEDAFEALCCLASMEKWCWRVGCTTCGSMHFRASLRKLVEGEHPGSRAWAVGTKRLLPSPNLLRPLVGQAVNSVTPSLHVRLIG